MQFTKTPEKLWPVGKVTDGSVVALYDVDDDGLVSIRGKGAPRQWEGGAIVVTERMSATLTTDHYVQDGHLLVIGKVEASTPKGADKGDTSEQARVVKASGRSNAVKTTKTTKATAQPTLEEIVAAVVAALAK